MDQNPNNAGLTGTESNVPGAGTNRSGIDLPERMPGVLPSTPGNPDPYPSLPNVPGRPGGVPANPPGGIPDRPSMPAVPGLNVFPKPEG
ncbi:hypothetical protein BV898_00296 [Hypsibius exemplaris]|uniref:Uncharacterized protein n=1 Tax=Hypsibius exemplaris TaxID=2072580 RepID=A0A1W0XFC4_HYPEX|nr:hypothetical protein BV898_00296 [Hypsibius exemplaris]